MYPTQREYLRIVNAGNAAALLMSCGAALAQHQYPTSDIPTDESAYLAKARTGGPEPIVDKASIIMVKSNPALFNISFSFQIRTVSILAALTPG